MSKNSGLFRSPVKQTKLSQFELCKMESLSKLQEIAPDTGEIFT
ncbi:unnamed protein product [Acanthoscelides obtectus]|uniref:Uncharacterized protein n=1 Tax=Acanthoscelides obtectus TaxID=200917 RepID=A0A9P0MCW8_ACAOB|nr:unnamed protein product [Acanthoscelides obtectus]CAH2010025.1 unnamed protein product [Acanthoscelides obtectus]CAK1671871.1 hypothetical protein AOBTE_LOCUS28513 [Acanthoscelides obtectus]CAK1671912.1 hypothetical protein AOBTE_LOCUS28531 [Acanthoscelides obtectus]